MVDEKNGILFLNSCGVNGLTLFSMYLNIHKKVRFDYLFPAI